jgi:hypothetical protein
MNRSSQANLARLERRRDQLRAMLAEIETRIAQVEADQADNARLRALYGRPARGQGVNAARALILSWTLSHGGYFHRHEAVTAWRQDLKIDKRVRSIDAIDRALRDPALGLKRISPGVYRLS